MPRVDRYTRDQHVLNTIKMLVAERRNRDSKYDYRNHTASTVAVQAVCDTIPPLSGNAVRQSVRRLEEGGLVVTSTERYYHGRRAEVTTAQEAARAKVEYDKHVEAAAKEVVDEEGGREAALAQIFKLANRINGEVGKVVLNATNAPPAVYRPLEEALYTLERIADRFVPVD